MHSQQPVTEKEIDNSLKLILADWLNAIASFFRCYNQVITCIRQRGFQHDSRIESNTYEGQCPMDQLQWIAFSMRRELEKLFQDWTLGDQLKKQPTRKKYNKLAVHTLRLNHLKDQAQLRLDLINVSAS